MRGTLGGCCGRENGTGWGRRLGATWWHGRQGRTYSAELPNHGTSYVAGQRTPCQGSIQATLHMNLSAIRRFLLCRPVDLNACEEGPFQPWESMHRGAGSRTRQSGTVGLGQVTEDRGCNPSSSHLLCKGGKIFMDAFKGGLTIVSPGSWQPSSCSVLGFSLLDFIFINYFHSNKYITYTLDDQEISATRKELHVPGG